MSHFILWFLIMMLVGWCAFPLTFRLFPAFIDRGYSFSRILGLLIWGYLFWVLACLGIVQNDAGGILLAMIILAGLSAFQVRSEEKRRVIFDWIRSNWRTILFMDSLFLVAFAGMAFIRAGNPEILGTEKPMELAFINAILNSSTFPPHDPWLSGFGISYYYFGYVMAAMLAKASGSPGSVAFNLMLALVFSLAATGALGILYNFLSTWVKRTGRTISTGRLLSSSLLGPLFLLIVSNFEGFLEVLHRMGVFWNFTPSGQAVSSFWKWLDIQNLRDAPALPLGVIPERYYWWWRASRVVTDYNLAGQWNEIIDEFPFFSFLLGDLHPHVLAIPFIMLATGVALHIILGGWRELVHLGPYELHMRPEGILLAGLILGGLAFLNTWDVLIGLGLMAGALFLAGIHQAGWTWKRVEELVLILVVIILLAFLLYLPFFMGFSSQAGGILPNLENPTRGIQLWVMFGPLFLGFLPFIVNYWIKNKDEANWQLGFGFAGLLLLTLWGSTWLLGWLASIKLPDFAFNFLTSRGFQDPGSFFQAGTIRRLTTIGGAVTLSAFIGAATSFLFSKRHYSMEMRPVNETEGTDQPIPQPIVFFFLLVFLGAVLVLVPDFIYLRDQFGNRMNTVFKFYFQAWQVLALAAAIGTSILLINLRRSWNILFRLALTIVLCMAFVYPVFGTLDKTGSFQIPAFIQAYKGSRAAGDPTPMLRAMQVWTLDGAEYMRRIYPDDMAGTTWFQAAPYGVVVEASKPDASYTDFSRVSTYSGFPTILGWPMHEGQWRGSYDPQGNRQQDIRSIYELRDWESTLALLRQYNVRYIFVGSLERSTYRIFEDKFEENLTRIFSQAQVIIYEVP